ncbi:hypothetical protein CYMTET_35234 [Cymbomonas tetramitiformis]|uniref:Uncharacterized protein n=1 Tax=Cymbomonas tetramitiformis TaxID=36881 RepID=A0AAE0F9Y7_9CHLO|nr:hypothetical protein CYMTET_35234 [Cymbomonas tetramitiformis]
MGPTVFSDRTLVYENKGLHKAETVIAAGNGKGHQYLAIGRDLAGPDTTCRHGPRNNVPHPLPEPAFRVAGKNGESVDSRCVATPKQGQRIPPTRIHHVSNKEWDDAMFNGVAAASQFSKYVASGRHKETYEDTKVKYGIQYNAEEKETRRLLKEKAANRKRAPHAGRDTKSSLTFGAGGK